MNHKKTIIALFFVSILLLAGLSTTVSSSNLRRIDGSTESNLIAPDQNDIIDEFKKEHPDCKEEELREIDNIIDRVIIEDEETEYINIDIEKLAEVIQDYNYKGISTTGEVNVIDEFIYNLIESLKKRLGYIYKIINRATIIIQEAQMIIQSIKTLPQEVKQIGIYLQNLIDKTIEVFNLTLYLLKGKAQRFLDKLTTLYTIVNDILTIIDCVIGLKNTIIDDIPNQLNYINDLIQQTITDTQEFVNYINSEPWKLPVNVNGRVFSKDDSTPLKEVKISCREKVVYTDENGEYNFNVDITDDGDSSNSLDLFLPHNCNVKAEIEGAEKSTINPFVFSDGEIYKDFYFKEVDDDNIDNGKIKFFSKFTRMQSIFEFLSNFFLL
mgnify:CR=1 FL=1